MKFEENTAVTILRPQSETIVKTWTIFELPREAWSLAYGEGSTVGDVLRSDDEGIYWARGHDDETAEALLVARALR